jgi:hypothetical protein
MTKVRGTTTKWEKVGLVESRDLLLEAKAFRESIAAGEVKAAPEAPSTGGGGGFNNGDDEIPF